MKTYLVMNPPFKIGRKLYKKYARKFDKDVWLQFYKQSSIGLLCNKFELGITWEDGTTNFVLDNKLMIVYNDKEDKNIISSDEFNSHELYCKINDFNDKNYKIIDKDNFETGEKFSKIRIDFKNGRITLVENYDLEAFKRSLRYGKIKKCSMYKDKVVAVPSHLITEEIKDLIKTYESHQLEIKRKAFSISGSNGGSKENGQFFTPSCLADKLVSYLGKHEDNIRIIDLCCGNGALLEAAVRAGFNKDLMIGYDIDKNCIDYCNANGFRAAVKDTLKDEINDYYKLD